VATVTTTNIDNGSWLPYNQDGGVRSGSLPFAQISWNSEFTVAAKDAANESQINFVWNMPINYCYKLIELEVIISSVATTDLADIEHAMNCRMISPAAVAFGVSQFPGINFVLGRYVSEAESSWKTAPDSETNDFECIYLPRNIPNQLLDGRDTSIGNVPSILGFLMNTKSDATAALNVTTSGLAFAYTIDQYLTGLPSAALPVT